MNLLTLKLYYIKWHYSRGLVDIFNIWTNFLWFVWNFFSIGLLTRTLFSPWRRMGEERKSGFDFGDIGSVILVNIIMRFVGALIRIWVILAGIVVYFLTLVAGLAAFILWVFMPAIIAFLFVMGLILIL